MAALDSKYDLRLASVRDELKEKVRKCLSTKIGQSTREVSRAVECNHEQARRILGHLWNDGQAVPQGDKYTRLWFSS